MEFQVEGERGVEVALPPEEFNRLAGLIAEKIASAAEAGTQPALVTSTKRRRFLHTMVSVKGLANAVLSYDEIGMDAKPALVGLVPA
jgi:flagellar biosynthesis protein FlhA